MYNIYIYHVQFEASFIPVNVVFVRCCKTNNSDLNVLFTRGHLVSKTKTASWEETQFLLTT